MPAMPPTCRLQSSMLLSSSILAATSSCWWLCLSWSIAAACWWLSSERKEAGYHEQTEKFILDVFTLIYSNSPAPSSIAADLKHTLHQLSNCSVFYFCCFLKTSVLHQKLWSLTPSKRTLSERYFESEESRLTC